jgi:hypothetical protein
MTRSYVVKRSAVCTHFRCLWTFARIAAVYNTNQEGQTGDGITVRENASGNSTEVSQSSGADANLESGS